ncbi:MAG: RNA polymerase sigma factor [bacterium]|nr:RNA polymerase sigma factor [bacterium]
MRASDSQVRELLAEHGRSVRVLAAALVGHGPEADDVVQETWLAAMRRPPHHGRDLRAWLAAIVRNVVRQSRRSRARQRRHERAAPQSPEVQSPAQLVERADLQRRIVAAVLALPEPTRATVLLRYFEGLSPPAIAEQHGVPLETVRTRLRRGLQRVRAELDVSAGRSQLAWLPVAARIAAQPGAHTVPFTTALLMSIQTKVGAAVAAVLVVLLVVGGYRLLADPVEVKPLGEVVEPSVAHDARRGPGESEVGPEPDSNAAATRVAASTLTEVHGLLTGLQPGLPVTSNVRLRVIEVPHSDTRQVSLEAPVAADGSFVFRVEPWVVQAVAGGKAPIADVVCDDSRYLRAWRSINRLDLRATVMEPLRLSLQCAGVLRGVVERPDGTPFPDALVSAYRLGPDGPETDPIAKANPGHDGRYEMRLPERMEVVVLAYCPDHGADPEGPLGDADPDWLPGCMRALAVPATITEVQPIRIERAFEVSGRVTWPDGSAARDARVYAGVRGAVTTLQPELTAFAWLGDGHVTRNSSWTRSDDRGRFVLRGLSAVPTDLDIQWVGEDPVVADRLRRVVTPPAEIEFGIDAVQLLVAVTDGVRAIDDAEIVIRNGSLAFRSATEGGRRRVALGRDRSFGLIVKAPGYETRELEWRAPPGATQRELEVVLTARPVHDVRVVMAPSVEYARFALTPRPAAGASAKTGEGAAKPAMFEPEGVDGTFVLPAIAPGRYELTLTRPGDPYRAFWLVEQSQEIVVPSPEPVRWPATELGGRILVRCRSHEGRFFAGRCEIRDVDGALVTTPFHVLKTGSSWFGGDGVLMAAGPNETARNLAPGQYAVRVTPDGLAPREQWVVVEPRKVVTVEFEY